MDERDGLVEVWPLFGLAVRTPRLELRYPTDHEVARTAALSGDIHDPGFMPFHVPWTRIPEGERERQAMQHHWRSRASLTADDWALALAVVVDGEPVGIQAVLATSFAARRTVETGSWLHRPRQGQGLGREMREAVLHLAFAGLGAERAETATYEGNEASLRITTGIGYRPNGDELHQLDGKTRTLRRFVLERADWEPRRRDDIEIVGLDPCRPLLGAP